MSGRIFIGNLSLRTRERDIEDKFERFGKIRGLDLKYGYAFLVSVLLFSSLLTLLTLGL